MNAEVRIMKLMREKGTTQQLLADGWLKRFLTGGVSGCSRCRRACATMAVLVLCSFGNVMA